MRKKRVFLTLLCCLLCIAAVLTGVTLYLRGTMPVYPDSLGSDPNVTEKITGLYLLREAARQPDTLLIFGSSELKTTDICSHPANFFADRRCGFQVNLIGRGSCQSLVHALAIAAGGDALNGKKVVLITAPQSYVEDGIAADLFMANFSELQVLAMLDDDTISDEVKTYLSSRIQALIDRYNEENGTSLQRNTAAGLLTDAKRDGNGLISSLLLPYRALSYWALDCKDKVEARAILRDYNDVPVPQEEAPIDWDAEEQAALAQAAQMVTNNDFSMQDDYYSTYVGRKLDQQEGKDSALSYDVSPEYDDLRCLLEICRLKGMDVLFVHVPMNGKWNDYTGFSADRRESYYEKVRAITEEYENVTLLDLTRFEYEPYFLCDTMHLGWKGWLEVDRAIIEFYR
ncbi:MAG: D-alanyl-lipoteichoic acid biosynthesis protein DltD [Oscillospiraceae bacterium]|nr:D-alanyl-lipoteichoic acid biosynthesis protein DltD [Oscillospiraceae bacterium]